MKRTLGITGAALALALVAGGVAVAAQTDTPAPAAPRSDAPASPASLDRTGGFSVADTESSSALPDSRVVADAPQAASEVAVTLDQSEIEQYWLWAAGVQVTAHGLTPGSAVRVSITFSNGERKEWAPVTADADGSVVTVVRTIDVDPENTHPTLGLAQIGVQSSAGETGSALLRITKAPGETLVVSSDPATISQDAFLDQPVIVHASGFPPMTSVSFNLGMPDTSMVAVGENEGLHSDEKGEFSYELQMPTVNAQVGTWTLSFQSFDGALEGASTFTVTPGAPRTADKTIVPEAASITAERFATAPGLSFDISGFLPFDTYELSLTTSRGLVIPLGISRTNGVGAHHNSILAPAGVPEGVWTLEARSTTTGDYATVPFTVTDNPALPASTIALSTAQVSATALADPASGVVLTGADVPAGTELRVSLRDANGNRMPLTVGADAYVTAGEDGRLSLSIVTLQPAPAGHYTVWAVGGGGVFGFNARLPLEVTGEGAETAPTGGNPAPQTAPSAPSGTATVPLGQTPLAPIPAPVLPKDWATPAEPAPRPSTDATPAPDPLEDGLVPPVVPIPSVPAN